MTHLLSSHHRLVHHLHSMTPVLADLLVTPWKQGLLAVLQHHLKHSNHEPDELLHLLKHASPRVKRRLKRFERRHARTLKALTQLGDDTSSSSVFSNTTMENQSDSASLDKVEAPSSETPSSHQS